MGFHAARLFSVLDSHPADILVGKRLKDMRTMRGYSLRVLAERSGLNINTLSLIENGKSSPSVSTLQQLALALEVPIAAFFESEPVEKKIVYTKLNERPTQDFGMTMMQNLGKDLAGNAVQPFVVEMKPGMGSGEKMIIHTGFEFVYCLSGSVHYQVEQKEFVLQEGDSLVFDANMPHRWENGSDITSQFLLLLYPDANKRTPGVMHFSAEA